MSFEIAVKAGSIGPKATPHEEVPMVRQERWEEIRRLWFRERVPIAQIARQLDLDRKTVRRYVAVAQECGLARAGGEEQLGDGLLSAVAERVRPHRPGPLLPSPASLIRHYSTPRSRALRRCAGAR